MTRKLQRRSLKLDPVYPITDSPSQLGRNHVEQATTFLTAGIRFFQVRDKESEDLDLLQQLLAITDLCDSAGASYLVNDRVDLALASGATGVHLGQTDLPVPVARQILGNEGIIGLSTHSEEQFKNGLGLDLDYIAVGPIFLTRTKVTGYPALGTEILGKFSSRCHLPLVAIGGIFSDNVMDVWRSGADSVAVISAISGAPEPEKKLRQLIRMHST